MHPMQSGDGDVVDSSAYRLKATNGSPASAPATTAASNGASKQNGNGEAAYQNGGRRDSTQMWTPLLPQTQSPQHHGNGNGNGAAVNGGRNGGVAIIGGDSNGLLLAHDTDTDAGDADATTILYSPHHTNNNDWKDAEELHNLKNGLLHYKTAAVATGAPAEGAALMNGGKNGDKYDEQDPLTGPRHHHQHQHLNNHQHNGANLQQNNHQQHHHQHGSTPGYKPKKLPKRPDGPDSDESDYEGASLKKKDPLNGSTVASDKKSPSSSGFSSGSSGSMASSGSLASSSAGEDDGPAGGSACGLFGCHPKWARNFASTNVFMVVFLLAYILQGMYMTYFVSVITTIEKLFQIKSKTTGFLLSASEMGQISTALLLTYFAGRGHRPRWIACGMVLFSIAAFSCSLPHFIFGKQLLPNALLNGPPAALMAPTAPTPAPSQILHSSLLDANSSAAAAVTLATAGPQLNLCILNASAEARASGECDEDRKLEQASHSKITVIVLCIFFVSLLSSGIGQTAVATLGIPYIDDNVASKQSPMYMAITIGVRILGPASGFIVGSFCTRWYVNFSNPGFDASDPRWIGAWWMGPVVIGTLMMLSSIAMFSFPRQLRGKKPPPPANASKMHEANGGDPIDDKPKLKDFPKTVRRQLSNDILMFRTASCVFHLLPIAGLYTFLPKYLETQFRVATYDANMIAAFCGILVMGVGIVISGMVILKLKPSARSVAAWIAFTALVYSAGMVILMFVGCSMNDFAGYKESTSTSPAVIEPACSAALNCTCDTENFAPICGVDGKIYISACHAGCVESQMRPSDNRTVFSQCSCIPDSFSEDPAKAEAVSGYCDSNCKNFVLFILIFAVCVFMHSTSEVGSMLLVMRCTHPKDKAMAMGVIQSAIGLFGNVPCPIIYGAVVDSACLIWKTVCGKHGACSLYDADTFRHYFLGITAGIMFLAFIMDLVVWSKAHRIDITPEDGADEVGPNGRSANGAAGEPECTKAMASPDTRV